jgi:methyl-accepting chemotaxis protein
VTQVGEITGVVADIAGSAEEQATGLAEVNTAMGQMDRATQQNAAMVEESTAASRAVASETDELAQLTKRFNVGAGPQRANVAPLRRAAPPARAIAMKVTAHGGSAARKPAPEVAAESWEEF